MVLVPPRVICEVGDGGGWPTSQVTRGGTSPFICIYIYFLFIFIFGIFVFEC